MQLGHLAEQFAGLLVPRLRCFDGDLDNLVPALVCALIQDAFFAQPEPLAVPGALRNLEQGPAIDGGYFDLGA